MFSIFGTNRSDFITGTMFSDHSSDASDFIFALDGNDMIFARGGDDVIKGGGGADTIDGGSGNDTASYFDSNTSVIVNLATGRGFGGFANGDRLIDVENLIGSTHSDLLVGDDGNNELEGLAGNDTLRGGGGHDVLKGGADNDKLYGEDGRDFLYGGTGRDTLIGGAGGDQMTGGADADTFKFTGMADIGDGSDRSYGSTYSDDRDHIIDFQIGTDAIDLSAIDADVTRDGDQAFSVVGSFTGAAGQLMLVDTGLSRIAVVIDQDGDAVEDAFFYVHTTSGALLSATDFVL